MGLIRSPSVPALSRVLAGIDPAAVRTALLAFRQPLLARRGQGPEVVAPDAGTGAGRRVAHPDHEHQDGPVRYLLTSLPPAAADAGRRLALRRVHWRTETTCVHVKEDRFGEDHQVVGRNLAGAVLAARRSTAHALP